MQSPIYPRILSLLLVSVALFQAPRQLRADEATIDLSPSVRAGDTMRIEVEFEAGGHDLIREHDVAKGTVGETRKLPMSVTAKLQYDERWLTAPAPVPTETPRPLTLRYYDTADVTIKVDEGGAKPELPADRRLILVEEAVPRSILSSTEGPLSREQLDLIDVFGNSAAIDRLLPKEPVGDGDSWKHESPEMSALLALDSIAVCEVRSVLEEFNGQFAKIRLAGVIHGTIDGAATELDLRAVYLFDRRLKRVTRLNLAVRENRSIGDATPGLEAVAKVQMTVTPVTKPTDLSDAEIGAQQITHMILHTSPQHGFQVEHDRQWFVTSLARESVTLRRVDSTGLIAQCTLSTLPHKSEGRQTSLEQFQKDVTYSLGKNFGELVSARQWTNKQGHYCFEVVARGEVQEVPVQWHYYLIAQESGHRVSAAFTMEGPMVERLAATDRAIVESLELIPITRETAETAAKPRKDASR